MIDPTVDHTFNECIDVGKCSQSMKKLYFSQNISLWKQVNFEEKMTF